MERVAKMTSKRQITVPREFRKELGVGLETEWCSRSRGISIGRA